MPHFEHMHVATMMNQRMMQEGPVPAPVIPAEVVAHPPGDEALHPDEPSQVPEEPAPTILGVPVTPAPPLEENAPPAI